MKTKKRKVISKTLEIVNTPMFRHKVEPAMRGRKSYNRKRFRMEGDV